MRPDVRISLSDVEQATRDITEYLEEFDMEAYSRDGKSRHRSTQIRNHR